MRIIQKINTFILLLLGVFAFNVQLLNAQDIVFSQPLHWLPYYNPGSVGFKTGLSAIVGYQNYLVKLPSNFESRVLSLDYSLAKPNRNFGLGGVGLIVASNTAGEVQLQSTSISIPFSTRVMVAEGVTLQLGVSPSIYMKSYSQSDLILGDQLDPYYGLIASRSPSLYQGMRDHVNLFDLSWGFQARWDLPAPGDRWYVDQTIRLGFAAHHFPQGDQSFLKNDNTSDFSTPLPTKYVFLADYFIPMRYYGKEALLSINPYFIYEKQSELSYSNVGAEFYVKNLIVGLALRNEQHKLGKIGTMIYSGGIMFPLNDDKSTMMKVVYSLDMPVYNGMLNRNFSHELTVNVDYRFVKKKRWKCLICP